MPKKLYKNFAKNVKVAKTPDSYIKKKKNVLNKNHPILNIEKMSVLPKHIYMFNAIAFKFPVGFTLKRVQVKLRFI